jgi:hypothetical protein
MGSTVGRRERIVREKQFDSKSKVRSSQGRAPDRRMDETRGGKSEVDAMD